MFSINQQLFFKKKALRLYGGYFVQPKSMEPLQATQLLISAPTGNAIKIAVDAPGKC